MGARFRLKQDLSKTKPAQVKREAQQELNVDDKDNGTRLGDIEKPTAREGLDAEKKE